MEPLKSTIGFTLGTLAVDIFFITSGFLITGSLLLRDNLISFAWNRVLRIYPALIIATIFCVFIVNFYFTTMSTQQYFSDSSTFKFLFKNSSLIFGIQSTLPNVFGTTPFGNTINGSLWTLPWELIMYASLFLMASVYYLFSIIKKKHLFLAILLVGFISTSLHLANHFLEFIPINGLVRELRLLSMFFVGSSFYVLKDRILLSNTAMLFAIGALLLASFWQSLFFIVYFILIGYVVLSLAYLPSGKIRNFNIFGDYSYGMYIYAFPIQQSIAAIIPGVSVLLMILISFFVTFILSFISWHVIEKRMLKHKDKYVYIEKFIHSLNIKRLTNRST